MSLQSSVGLYRAVGVAGDPATPHQMEYYALNLPADDDGVNVGNFVWVVNGEATNTAVSGSKPLGLAQRNLSYPLYNVTSEGSMVVPEGLQVMTAVKGDFYVKTTTTATVGQKAFALADGKVACANAGATVSGGIETDWRVVTAGVANDTIIISNWVA